jgi:hypothetical protein
MMTPAEIAEKGGALTRMVGAIVIYYAILEHWIDGMVATLHFRVPDANRLRKQYPFNAKDEVSFLRESFEGVPALAKYKNQGLHFLDKLEPLSDFRHNIIHGNIREIDWAAETMEFSRIIRGDDKNPVRRTMTIVGSELFHQGEDIRALIPQARLLTHLLIAEFGAEDEIQKLAGPLVTASSHVRA